MNSGAPEGLTVPVSLVQWSCYGKSTRKSYEMEIAITVSAR